MKKLIVLALMLQACLWAFAQTAEQDSLALEKLRAESGVDPTRIQTRLGYSFLIADTEGSSGSATNRLSFNLGVQRWSFTGKYEIVSRLSGEPGTGFSSGLGDIRFSILNAFLVKGNHAVAASAELSVPVGKPGLGTQYLSLTPSLTYSYTINPTLFLAFQPQYTFALLKDPRFPDLSVLTIRAFVAKFTRSGFFFVFEPRPIFDFTNDQAELVISPIVGKSIGGGYNLLGLVEYPTKESSRALRGVIYQIGFNKNF
ncbi:MAG: hypothetical protein SFV52_01630 [Saprospiraceae bacterium]|nr:hypothetical protein [Saprospiraceae bacterium]